MRKGMKARVIGWVLVFVFLLLNIGIGAPLQARWLDDAVCESPGGGYEHCCSFCVFFCDCTIMIE